MLQNAHSFKDKSDRLSDVNVGLFAYPVLMAADILLYDVNEVPVGKDQVQHLEITRDIARAFNHAHGDTFVVPEVRIDEQVMIVPGTDGQKMSKSYNNFINIFLPEKELKKQVMTIVTDATPLEEPKNPDTCNVFALYKLLANTEQIATMKDQYLKGGYGYGHAKNELLGVILDTYKDARIKFDSLMNDTNLLNHELNLGATKAKKIAAITLQKVREKVGV
jgi:tryptophanyl-tRNA synthetase